jgi:PAS domain S-box-containing protein
MFDLTHGRFKLMILVPLALALLVLLCLSVLGTYHIEKREIAKDVESRIAGVEKAFLNEVERDAELMRAIIDFLQKDPDIQKAWLAQDKETLLARALPVFEEIRSRYRVTHFYFIKPDRNCFLRVHHPQRHGDVLERFTLTEAARSGTSVHGIELGPYGTLTLRVVYPWRIDGRLAGYIELGEEIDHITPTISKHLGLDLAVTLEKKYLSRDKWEEGLRMLGRSGDWDLLQNFVILGRTATPAAGRLAEQLKDLDSTAFAELLSSTHRPGIGDRHCYRSTPLTSANGTDIGHLILLLDVENRLERLFDTLLLVATVSIIIGGSLFIFFAMLVGGIEQRLAEANRERDVAAEELQKKEEQYRTLFESSHDAIMTLEPPSWAFTSGNRSCVEMFGAKDQSDFTSHPPWELSPETQPGGCASGDKAKEMIETAMHEGSHFFEWTHRRINGDDFPATVLLTRMTVGERTFLQATVRDVTEQTLTQDKLMQATEERQALDRQLYQQGKLAALGTLAHGASHEINNPINGIMNYAQLINDQSDKDGEIAAFSHEIIVESERIASIIRGMKTSSDEDNEALASAEINKLLESALMPLRASLEHDKIEVETSTPKNTPTLLCHSRQIKKLITSLICNSQDALNERYPNGDGDKIIQITASQIDENGQAHLRITVEDHGHGIPADIRERVFEPFFTTKERAVGAGAVGRGLGLSTALGIAHNHKGQLTVESEVDKWTRFHVDLPMQVSGEHA